MRILFVVVKMPGGVGRYVTEISKELKKLGHNVEIISRDEDVKTGFVGSFVKLRKEVKKRDYDVLMAEDWSIALPLWGLKNLFVTFNGISINFPANILQKIAYHLTNKRLIVVSDYLKRHFPKAKVIEEGVNLAHFKPKKKKKNNKTIIGFAQSTKDPIYRYNLIKKSIDDIKGFELHIAKNIGYSKMPDFYNSLDLFISLPKVAGFNLVWLEAMACNVITVGNNSGIGSKLPILKIKEPITEKKIKKTLEKSKEIKKINYRSWLENNSFTWESCAIKLINFLEKKNIN